MKKILWLGILVLIVTALSYLVLRKQNGNDSTLNPSEIDFKVDDPENVTRIFLTNKLGKRILLDKKPDGTWTLNDSLPAWQKQVDLLLHETMARLSVKGVVHQNARDNIVSQLAALGTKAEIYRNGEEKPFKEYYVGGTTPDLLGTYFWIEGAEDPMILDIPGHSGFVNSRYELNADYWISRSVFTATSADIALIQIDYPQTPENSFRITQRNDSLDLSGPIAINRSPNAGAIRSYLNLFEKLNFEGFVEMEKEKRDSITAQVPVAIITLTKRSGQSDTLTIFPKGSYEGMKGLYDNKGNRLAYDPDRYYAIWSRLPRLLTVQDYTFAKVLRTYPEFFNRI
ncbi:MAG: hypothetical protein H6606_01265 [Flavobacteriales bacterium]|nr:hypothetical protein [Flavobacteriales bacterium]